MTAMKNGTIKASDKRKKSGVMARPSVRDLPPYKPGRAVADMGRGATEKRPDPGKKTPIQNPGIQDTGIQNPATQKTSVQNPGVQNPGVQNPGVQNPAVQNPAVQKMGRAIKMSSNESALGASPAARRALRLAGPELHRYPDAFGTPLRRALSRRHGLDPERIICGNGSDDLIVTLAKAYAGDGDEIVMSRYGFVYYTNAAAIAGARLVKVDEKISTTDPATIDTDVDGLIAACGAKTRLLFLANPNNPTGSWLSAARVRHIAKTIPPHVLLVLDGAYAEYMCDSDYSPGYDLVDQCANVVTLGTFSKIFGLAGIRIGWAYGPQSVIDVLYAVRAPFSVNSAALHAALAALADDDFTAKVRDHTILWRTWLARRLRAIGLDVYASVGNFLLLRFNHPGAARGAEKYLRDNGVLLRTLDEYGLADCLRISVSRASHNRLAVRLLRQWMGQGGGG